VPIGALNLSFPEGGRFPFRWGDFVMVLAASTVVALAARHSSRALRFGTGIYVLGAIAVFFVPNPLGGNLIRLATFLAGPLLAGLLWPQHRRILLCSAIPLLIWQWYPAIDDIVAAGRDPSAKAVYFQPLLDYLGDNPLARIEIPFTKRHWEAAYVAPHVPLARGWERQLDIGNNPLFYQPGLTADDYRQWLANNAISYVALADVPLDYSGKAEAALLRDGMTGLEPVFQSAHWQVWKVTDTKPLVEGPARLAQLEPNSFLLDVEQPGQITVRIRYSANWDVDGQGCLVESPEGWTIVRSPTAGPLRVRQVSNWVPFGSDGHDDCPKDT
jgi:hypothetical protein